MREKKDCSKWRSNADNPTAGNEVGRDWRDPENPRQEKQNHQSSPLKGAAGSGVYMRLTATHCTHPAFPKPEWQERNPKDVCYIKRPNLYCPAGVPTRKTVVVPECQTLWPKMVHTMDYEHVNPRPSLPTRALYAEGSVGSRLLDDNRGSRNFRFCTTCGAGDATYFTQRTRLSHGLSSGGERCSLFP